MCGIFGIFLTDSNNDNESIIRSYIDNLFLLSESRGKEASGIAIRTDDSIVVMKKPIPSSKFIKLNAYKSLLHNTISKKNNSFAAIGHCRLATNGGQENNINNHPIVKDGAVGVHNGIIVNVNELDKRYSNIHRESDVDTELLFALLQSHRSEENSIITATQKTFKEVDGAASICILFNDSNYSLLATNTGSLYFCINDSKDTCLFASEKVILEQLFFNRKLRKEWGSIKIIQVNPFQGYLINLNNLDFHHFTFTEDVSLLGKENDIPLKIPLKIVDMSEKIIKNTLTKGHNEDVHWNREKVIRDINDQHKPGESLKRCTKCILPETFPGISFDKKGVCNYCRDYKKYTVKGREALEELVAPYRNNSGDIDCIVGFSGGRDSSYMLHYIKKELKMNPVAFTYDWGMVTDLARRNQARICGKLGVEQVIISADINKKRENIRKNIHAWLKKPDLGMVPLLMAGDKQFYYYAHQLLDQTGAKIIFNGGNAFEKTEFKLGFCNIHDNNNGEKGILTGISQSNKLKLLQYYQKQYILNPSYINSSIFDTLHAYYSSYLLPDAYVYFYQYIPWDENEIVSLLRREYDWEVATDTNATWRIGDGTAAFYDYIYYTVTGFSEFDTFRSNQIREGLLTRDEALKLVNEENIPRYESLEWYAKTIGFDLEDALNTIHSIPKMWQKQKVYS